MLCLYFQHPQYGTGPGFAPNDLALLHVSMQIVESNKIKYTKYIAEPETDRIFLKNCTIAGYGATECEYFLKSSMCIFK